MAEVIREEKTREEPGNTTVIHERDEKSGSNTGAIIGLALLVIILLFLFFGKPFAGGDGDTDINVQPKVETPAPTTGQ